MMSHVQKLLSIVAILLSTLVCSADMHVYGARDQPADQLFGGPIKSAADEPVVVSDREPESAAAVAREVIRLQQQLGGSIVKDRPQLQSLPSGKYQHRLELQPHDTTLLTWPATPPTPAARFPQPSRKMLDSSPRAKITELREAAWQLDATAYRLEKLDLYGQADALRGVARQLRHDAREMKQQADSAAATVPRYELPKAAEGPRR